MDSSTSNSQDSLCTFVPSGQTCYSVYDPANAFSLDIIFLSPASPSCPSPRKILLVLFTYNLVTFIVTLITKSICWLAPIRHWYGEVAEKPRSICILIPTGSFLIQILFTAISGQILAGGGSDDSATAATLTILWFARPLPTLLLALPLLTSPAGATELFLTDFLYRLIAIGGFCIAAHATATLALPPDQFIVGYDASPYLSLVKAGAALGILTFLGSFFCVVLHVSTWVRSVLWTDWRRSWPCTVLFLLGAHVVYTGASWLLWAGLLFAVPEGFCPGDAALGLLGLVWLIAAVIDNLWQEFALLLAIGDEPHCPRWITALGATLDRFIARGRDDE